MVGMGIGVGVGGGQAAFTPAKLAGLLLWLAADSGVASSDGSAEFNGTNQSLSITDNADLSTGDVTFWVAVEAEADALLSTFPVVAGKNATTSANLEWDLHVNQANSQFRFQTGGAAFRTVTQTGVMVLGQRYFLFCYHDNVADQNGISVDGGAFATASTSGTEPSDTTSALRVGARNGSPDRFWDGATGKLWFGKSPTASMATIRDRLWNGGSPIRIEDLTSQEITDFGIIPFWPLDDASSFNDSHGTNHLTNNNGVTVRTRTIALVDGIGISQVLDRSHEANHATQPVLSARPTYETAVFGEKPAIRFDGAAVFLGLDDIALDGDFTLSITAAVGAGGGAYFGHSSGTGGVVQTDSDTLTLTNDAGSSLVLDHLALDTGVHEITLVRSGDAVTRYLDGQEDGSGTLSGTITLDQFGMVGASSSPLDADLADVVLYGRAYT